MMMWRAVYVGGLHIVSGELQAATRPLNLWVNWQSKPSHNPIVASKIIQQRSFQSSAAETHDLLLLAKSGGLTI